MEQSIASIASLVSGSHPRFGLEPMSVDNSVESPKKQTRVVMISDTHLVHDQMRVPYGEVLVHAGDVLTESLLRHVKDGKASDKGEELFRAFAAWFCKLPHPFKGWLCSLKVRFFHKNF
jgi:hypothetical protein